MPRKLLERNSSVPYHVTARTNNREVFSAGLESTWETLSAEALIVSILYQAEFHALVLRPNHFHAIMTVPHHDLGRVMNTLMSSTTRILNTKTGRSGHVYGGPYHWSIIDSARYFGHALKYVYRNPVKAGLCLNAEDWKFSSLYGIVGNGHLPSPIHLTGPCMELGLPLESATELLGWLNRPFPKEAETLIQSGLRKRRFESVVNRNSRRMRPELEVLL